MTFYEYMYNRKFKLINGEYIIVTVVKSDSNIYGINYTFHMDETSRIKTLRQLLNMIKAGDEKVYAHIVKTYPEALI